ncbi:hypothetical protein ACUXOJ_002598, partial [Staphylococcus cohnii]
KIKNSLKTRQFLAQFSQALKRWESKTEDAFFYILALGT